MAYQYFSKVSLLSFMPSMMQVVTNESITSIGMLYMRTVKITVSVPIGASSKISTRVLSTLPLPPYIWG